jgi:hypothetical protein
MSHTARFLLAFVFGAVLVWGSSKANEVQEGITLDCGTLKGTGSISIPLGKGRYGHIMIECEGVKI